RRGARRLRSFPARRAADLRAEAEIVDGTVRVQVQAGDVVDETVLRSYCTGAAHMALSWVSSEGLAVDDDGTVHDLTIRSFGILRSEEHTSELQSRENIVCR